MLLHKLNNAAYASVRFYLLIKMQALFRILVESVKFV